MTINTVEKVNPKLHGSARPRGTDFKDLQHWLLRFRAGSEALRSQTAEFANWFANNQPTWAAYMVLMGYRLEPLDMNSGTRPVGIREIYQQLMAKCVIFLVW